MIHVPTNPLAHYAFDLAAWIAAALAARWQHRRWPDQALALSRVTRPSYFIALGLGAVAGAWLFGSANSLRGPIIAPSHSIAGALAGGIVAVEIYKLTRGISGSTGLIWVGPLALGIAIGRWGCLLAGLPDETYGLPTRLPCSELPDPVPLRASIVTGLGVMNVFAAVRENGTPRRRLEKIVAAGTIGHGSCISASGRGDCRAAFH